MILEILTLVKTQEREKEILHSSLLQGSREEEKERN
jgi:hypothetical protein